MGRRRRKPRAETEPELKTQKRRMLMNVVDPEEIRVAILDNDKLEELYIERGGSGYNHGNIYKGKVQNIEPTLQAAFIDIGGEKNGFLHVSDVVQPYGGYDGILKRRRRKAPPKDKRLPIEQMLYKGQEVLVQITRESLSTKGPSLTTYISLPGRYLVLMPAVSKRGVSRKIRDEKERKELKNALDELDPPADYGFIIRTAGMGRGKEELNGDLNYLIRLWDAIVERTKKAKPPEAIYQESDLVIRAIRDYLYEDVGELLIDGEDEYKRSCEFLRLVLPDFEKKAFHYKDSDPLFHRFKVDHEIESIIERKVKLKCGGSIVIEQTEALVAIDVNSGSFRKSENTREMILAANLDAVSEIARQLRLRDMGGLLMIDFIDMEQAADRRKVEEAMREGMRHDRARVKMLPISQLGVMEMTRQRVRQSLRRTLFRVCPMCGGSGFAKSPDVIALEFLRRLRVMARDRKGGALTAYFHPSQALGIANARRAAIAAIEQEAGIHVSLAGDETLGVDEMHLDWADDGAGTA